MNGGHCKPAESIPGNAYKIKPMADLWFSRQVFWGMTLYCTASGCRRFETTPEVLWNTSLRNARNQRRGFTLYSNRL